MSSKKLDKLEIKLIGLLGQISTFELMLQGNYQEVYLKYGKMITLLGVLPGQKKEKIKIKPNQQKILNG